MIEWFADGKVFFPLCYDDNKHGRQSGDAYRSLKFLCPAVCITTHIFDRRRRKEKLTPWNSLHISPETLATFKSETFSSSWLWREGGHALFKDSCSLGINRYIPKIFHFTHHCKSDCFSGFYGERSLAVMTHNCARKLTVVLWRVQLLWKRAWVLAPITLPSQNLTIGGEVPCERGCLNNSLGLFWLIKTTGGWVEPPG